MEDEIPGEEPFAGLALEQRGQLGVGLHPFEPLVEPALGPADALVAGVRRGLGTGRAAIPVGGHAVNGRQRPHPRPGPRFGLDQALVAEQAERVADRRLRHAVRLAQLGERGQPATGPVLTGGDAAPPVSGDPQILGLCHRRTTVLDDRANPYTYQGCPRRPAGSVGRETRHCP